MKRTAAPLLALLAALAATASTEAASLRVAVVADSDVRHLFDLDGQLTRDETSASFKVLGASGEGLLLSWISPPGEVGTAGAGLVAYEYRLDVSKLRTADGKPCIDRLRLQVGAFTALDYDGDGQAEEVWVGARGDAGDAGPGSAALKAGHLNFFFARPLCPGGDVFVFGFASPNGPADAEAQLHLTDGEEKAVTVRTSAAAR